MNPSLRHDKPRKELLCVDDDFNTLMLRKLVLEAAGYSVRTADSGERALQALERGMNVDLVLLDYLMPGMNGNELAMKLRERYPHLPLIAVSAVGQLPDSLLKTVNAHIQKGQGPELLLSTVSAILEQLHHEDLKKQPVARGTVLCVDDEELQLKVRRMLFESSGYLVLEAQGAASALEKFQRHQIDAVVMDYSLVGQDGNSIAKQMKQLRPGIPIIMLSGFPLQPNDTSNADLWLRKMDVEPEALVREMTRLIELRTPSHQVADR
jgi:CheY-like chemotaxis protein